MSTSTATMQKTPIAEAVANTRFDETKTELSDKISAYRRETLYDLTLKQQDLQKRWEEAGRITKEAEREAAQRVIKTESIQIALRREQMEKDQVEMALALEALLKDLGVRDEKLKELTADDKTILANADSAKASADQLLLKVKKDLDDANALRDTAVKGLESLKGKWFKDDEREALQKEMENANRIITAAPKKITDAMRSIDAANAGVAEAKAQVERNQAQRVRESTLSESFKTLDGMTTDIVNLFENDVKGADTTLETHQKALDGQLKSRLEHLERLKGLETEIVRIEGALRAKEDELAMVLDTQSPEYANLQKRVAELQKEFADKDAERKEASSAAQGLEIAISGTQESIKGILAGKSVARNMIIKIKYNSMSARVLATGVDQMIKMARSISAGDVVDRVGDELTFASVRHASEAQVAANRSYNAMLERFRDQRNRLAELKKTTDEQVGVEHDKMRQYEEELRARYEARGFNMDDAHLQGLVASVIEKPKTPEQTEMQW